jgi:hypothetical protein
MSAACSGLVLSPPDDQTFWAFGVDTLRAAIAQVAKMPDIVHQRRGSFSDSVGGTPTEFATFL